jgi:colanic acid/amylovoran biosynthesis glycosyltransferase
LTEPLRIAYLTSFFARPSDSFIRNEVNELRKLGLEVDTYSIRRPTVTPGEESDVDEHQRSTEYLLEGGIPHITLTALKFAAGRPRRFYRACRLAWRTSAPGLRGLFRQAAYLVEATYLASRLRERQIQLLHNHLGENSASVAMLAAEVGGFPFSMTIHGPYIFFAPEKWALGEKLSRAAFTACISDFCRSQCQMFAPLATWDRLQLVRCSVQQLFLDPPADQTFPSPARFVCVGRLCSEKGQLLLVDAVQQLRDHGYTVRVTLVGDGPLKPEIERRIQRYQLESSIELVGWQPSRRVQQLLHESTALVIASAAEGLPVVAMESLAVGCPVIATNIAAMSELVEHRVNGWLIASGSAAHLADAMLQAAQTDSVTLKQMGAAGRERVLALHHPKHQAQQLKQLFAAEISKPRAEN